MLNLLELKLTKTHMTISVISISVLAFLCNIFLGKTILPYSNFSHKISIFFILLLISVFSSYFLCKYICTSIFDILLCTILINSAILLRLFVFDYISADYTQFLEHWVDFFRQNNGIFALNKSVGDYNVPYLYFLSLISYSDINDLYLIKLFSVLFDFVLAYYCMRISDNIISKKFKSLVVYFLVLFFPLVWMNSALWGQCDSIYASFAIMALFYALKNRYDLCVIFMCLSFSFKLQAIFLFPILIVFILTRKMPLKYIFYIPFIYFISVLPAILLGKPFKDILSIYFDQTTNFKELTLNAPSAFALINTANLGQDSTHMSNALSRSSILIAFAFIVLTVYYFHKKANLFNHKVILLVAFLYSISVPWLLPHMHERYFFLAEILSIIIGIVFIDILYLPIIIGLASFTGYHHYLFGGHPIPLEIASFMMIFSIFIAIKKIRSEMSEKYKVLSL